MQCNFADSGVYISSLGKISPCCNILNGNSFTSMDQFYTDDFFKEVRNYNKTDITLSPHCVTCARSNWSLQKKSQDIIPNASPNVMRRLDISFGNSCNLNCVMCNNYFSSAWNNIIKDYEDEYFDIFHDKKLRYYDISYNQIDEILLTMEQHKTIESVIIKGGEPFYNKKTLYFLDKLYKGLDLSIVTNASVVNEKILELLDKFKSVTIVVSLDGTDQIYEWIRGYSWDTIQTNIKKLQKYNCTYQFTLTAYNFHALNKTYDICKDLGKFNLIIANDPHCNLMHVGRRKFYVYKENASIPIEIEYNEPLLSDKKNFIKFTEMMNKVRGFNWQDINVS
jgi:organic radical activating enzyme